MPTMKTKGKTMKEIIAQINEEKDRNPEFSKRFTRQLEKLQNYMDECEKFNAVGLMVVNGQESANRKSSRNQFMERIQIGSQTLPEFLGNIRGGKNNSQMLYFAAAFAAAMEPLDKKQQIEMNVFLPDKIGNVKVVPMVENAEKKPVVRKEDLNLWDKFCNLVGFKTEKYRAYEAEQKRIQMLESFQKTDSKHLYNEAIQGSKTKQEIKDNQNILDSAKNNTKVLNTLFFDDKKPEDWVMRDGTKVSALSVCMGILSGKEVGLKDVFTKCDLQTLSMFHREEIGKAVKIYKDLLEKRQSEKEMPDKFKYLDEFLFNKKQEFKISSQLEQEFLSKVEPHPEIENFTPANYLVTGFGSRNPGNYLPFEKAKEELYRATKDEKYVSSTEDVILRGGLYIAEQKSKLASLIKDKNFEQQSTMKLCANILKTSVYIDAMKSYYEACKEKGEKCQSFNLDDKESMMHAISQKIDELGLSEDSSRVHTIETVEMILQDKVTDSIKAELTVSPDPSITPVVEFKKLEMAFGKDREYESASTAERRERFWEKFDIQKDLDHVMEVDEVAEKEERELPEPEPEPTSLNQLLL